MTQVLLAAENVSPTNYGRVVYSNQKIEKLKDGEGFSCRAPRMTSATFEFWEEEKKTQYASLRASLMFEIASTAQYSDVSPANANRTRMET